MENDVSALSRVKGRLVKGEVGFSLIELVVAISLFSVFIALFLTAVVTLIRGTEQVTSTSEASSKSLIVFQNIDRQVRYADSINFPGDGSSGARYIEYRLPASSAPSGITTCYQWRFVPSTGQIQLRQWHDTVGSTPGSWSTKLTTATAPSVADPTYPFELIPATPGGSAKQQFVLTLNAGSPSYEAKADVTSTFVARNSSGTSPSNVDSNGDGASDTPVCLATGDRP